MLYEFVTVQRDAIIVRARENGAVRSRSVGSTVVFPDGPARFLTRLAATLDPETAPAFSSDAHGDASSGRAGDPLHSGFTIAQVIDSYVDTCRAITAIAFEQNAPVTVEEFHTLDRCLDESIAEAVTAAQVSRAARP